MREIPLTQGKVTIVSDEDFARLSEHKWHAWYDPRRRVFCARTCIPRPGGRDIVYMHRFLMGAKPGQKVDHWNHNTLDNRRDNLRVCSSSQNNANRLKTVRVTSNRFKGVSWEEFTKRWKAQICVNGKHITLGRFDHDIEGAVAYDLAARKHFGQFACCNFPEVLT